jgi:hypothetical protein
MLGRRVDVFRLLGFQVQVDTSWLILSLPGDVVSCNRLFPLALF